ncbi:MAG: tRNA uracil 4-sulfurtransferase ThiI [Candidatus Diapherotrites archaeon]
MIELILVIHYSEIATKGKNRNLFENQLMDNIRNSMGKNVKVFKRYGKILCESGEERKGKTENELKNRKKEKTELNEKTKKKELKKENTKLTELNDEKQKKELAEILKLIPGIANFSFAMEAKLEIKDIEKKCIEILKGKEFNSFKVNASRSNKNFKLNSMELNQKLGEHIINKLNKKVDLHSPELTVFIEVGEKEAFVYCEKFCGVGGLPVGSSGKVISSLSGGIDSPVASFMMMKRGCKVVFAHVFNKSIEGKAVLSKIESLVKELNKIQLNSKLYVIKFEEIQKELIANIPSKYRMIAYRRAMMKLMNLIAEKEKAKAVVTGDNVGQVASQTIENIQCIYEASKLPVLAPLIGFNKEEIIELSKKIKTYGHSILPYPDCCSFMIAKHPETKGRLIDLKKLEEGIPELNELIEKAVKDAEIKIINETY